MKKTLLLLALIISGITAYSQDTIVNGESGLSVRNKLNKALKPPVALRTLSGTDKIPMIKTAQTTGSDSTFTASQLLAWLITQSTNGFVTNATFNDTLYFSVPNRSYNPDTIKSNQTIVVKSTSKVAGTTEIIRFVGDGIHDISFGSINPAQSPVPTYNHTLNKVNLVIFTYDGVESWYTLIVHP